MKRLIYTLSIGGILLSACATPSENESPGEMENIENSGEEASAEDMAPASEKEIEQSEPVNEFDDYDELTYQEIFNPEDYDAHLITDNPGTRIFIFRDGEQQAFKTVYIKDENRLKVIDIANNELLFNEPIR